MEREESGAPQQSVLAVINCNDLPNCQQEAESVVYVDDDTDSVHTGDPDDLHNLIQREVNNSLIQ